MNCFSSFWNIVSPICTTTRNSHSPFVLSLWYSRRAKSVLCKYHNTNCFNGKFLNQKHSVAECHRIFTNLHIFHTLQFKICNTKSLNSSRHRILAVSIKLVILKISIILRQLSRKKNYILLVRKIGRSKCLIKVKTLLAWLVWTLEKVFNFFHFMGWSISQCPYPWVKQIEKMFKKHK